MRRGAVLCCVAVQCCGRYRYGEIQCLEAFVMIMGVYMCYPIDTQYIYSPVARMNTSGAVVICGAELCCIALRCSLVL